MIRGRRRLLTALATIVAATCATSGVVAASAAHRKAPHPKAHHPKTSHRKAHHSKPPHPKAHHRKPHQPTPAPVGWNPLARQPADAATTFLFDAAAARTQTPGNGGFIMGNATGRRRALAAYLQGGDRAGPVPSWGQEYELRRTGTCGCRPPVSFHPTAFTIEFWVKSPVAFSALPGDTPVSVSGISFTFERTHLFVDYPDDQTYPPARHRSGRRYQLVAGQRVGGVRAHLCARTAHALCERARVSPARAGSQHPRCGPTAAEAMA